MRRWIKLADNLFLTVTYNYVNANSIYQKKKRSKALWWVSAFLIIAISSLTAQEIKMPGSDSLRRLLNKTKSPVDRADIMLRLAQVQIFKHGENKIDFDSAVQCIRVAEQLNKSIQSPALSGYQLLTESYMVREKGDREAGRKMVERAITILEPAGNSYYLGRAYYALSSYYDNRDDITQLRRRITLVDRSIIAFAQSGHIEEKAFALTLLADLHYLTEDRNFDKCIDLLKQALAAYNLIGHKELQSVYELLGQCYTEKNDQKQATQYLLLAIKTAEDCNDTTMQLCKINNTLASVYSTNGQTELAVKYYEDGLKIAIKYENITGIATLAFNVSVTNDKLMLGVKTLNALKHIPAKFVSSDSSEESAFINLAFMIPYLQLGRYQEAGRYCRMILENINRPNFSIVSKSILYHFIAKYCFATKQFEKTRYYLKLNAPILKETASYKRLIREYKLWYMLDSTQGNYHDAFNYLLAYKAVSDSILNESKLQKIQQLQVEYETSKKEDSIKSKNQDIALLKQTNQLQMTNLRQANLIKNISTVGIILAIIIITLLFRQYNNKKLSNQVISSNNEKLQRLVGEKEWLLKEVHHRVKNNLQTVVSLLELQAETLSQDARAAIEASQNRIYATSLLHQKLYQDENVSSVDMATYIQELVGYLKDVHNIGNSIVFNLRISPINLDVSQAIPVGLIINEMITNSIKYAFKDASKQPEINISFENSLMGMVKLIISDNGSGFAKNKEENIAGLGLKLVEALTDDLDSETIIDSEEGTRLFVQFRLRLILPHASELAMIKADEPKLIT